MGDPSSRRFRAVAETTQPQHLTQALPRKRRSITCAWRRGGTYLSIKVNDLEPAHGLVHGVGLDATGTRLDGAVVAHNAVHLDEVTQHGIDASARCRLHLLGQKSIASLARQRAESGGIGWSSAGHQHSAVGIQCSEASLMWCRKCHWAGCKLPARVPSHTERLLERPYRKRAACGACAWVHTRAPARQIAAGRFDFVSTNLHSRCGRQARLAAHAP